MLPRPLGIRSVSQKQRALAFLSVGAGLAADGGGDVRPSTSRLGGRTRSVPSHPTRHDPRHIACPSVGADPLPPDDHSIRVTDPVPLERAR